MTRHIGPAEDIAACAALRRAVFIEEQDVSENIEQDGRACVLPRHGGAGPGIGLILACLVRRWHRSGLVRAVPSAKRLAPGFCVDLSFGAPRPVYGVAGGPSHRDMEYRL